MQTQIVLEKCLPFLNSELNPGRVPTFRVLGSSPPLSVTISRQSGSGAHIVATRLAEYFQARELDPSCPWAIFDRNLVEKVLEDHHLPGRFAQFMPEDRTSAMGEVLDELSDIILRQVCLLNRQPRPCWPWQDEDT